MNIRTGGGTLVHELTHALIVYDFPAAPTWFNESLGSLHEQCRIEPGRIVGMDSNWRLPSLQKALDAGKLRSLRDLMTKGDFYGPLRGLNYAHGRYFCVYMQNRGVLGDFYRRLRDDPAKPVDAAEAVLGESIDVIDRKYRQYVRTLRFPPE